MMSIAVVFIIFRYLVILASCTVVKGIVLDDDNIPKKLPWLVWYP